MCSELVAATMIEGMGALEESRVTIPFSQIDCNSCSQCYVVRIVCRSITSAWRCKETCYVAKYFALCDPTKLTIRVI